MSVPNVVCAVGIKPCPGAVQLGMLAQRAGCDNKSLGFALGPLGILAFPHRDV